MCNLRRLEAQSVYRGAQGKSDLEAPAHESLLSGLQSDSDAGSLLGWAGWGTLHAAIEELYKASLKQDGFLSFSIRFYRFSLIQEVLLAPPQAPQGQGQVQGPGQGQAQGPREPIFPNLEKRFSEKVPKNMECPFLG